MLGRPVGMPSHEVRRRAGRTATSLVVGLAVAFTLTGCTSESFCGANQVLSYVFCRYDDDAMTSTPVSAPPPAVPKAAPSASIVPSRYTTTIVQSVDFDGSWGDSDGRVVKFDWDLDGVAGYEISGTPTSSNHDHRSRTFTTFGHPTVRLRVTDNDGLTDVYELEITVARRQPTAVLTISPAAPVIGQQVTFDASGSSALDSTLVSYRWDIDGNNPNGYETPTDTPYITRTYDQAQTITVGVRAFDDHGDRGEVNRVLTIGPAALRALALNPAAAIVPLTVSVSTRTLTSAARRPPLRRPFSARLDVRPVKGQPGQVQIRGAVQTVRGMLVTGRFNGRLARVRPVPRAEAVLGRLLRAGYRARLDVSVDTRARKSTTTMLALATIPRAKGMRPAVACVRITLVDRRGRTPSGTFRVLGGTGDASRLSATGTLTFTPGPHIPAVLAGTVKARLIKARGLPRACRL